MTILRITTYLSRSSRKDSPVTSLRGQDNDSEYHSYIVTHDFGLLYPIPSGWVRVRLRVRPSLGLVAFQSGVTSFSLKVF